MVKDININIKNPLSSSREEEVTKDTNKSSENEGDGKGKDGAKGTGKDNENCAIMWIIVDFSVDFIFNRHEFIFLPICSEFLLFHRFS